VSNVAYKYGQALQPTNGGLDTIAPNAHGIHMAWQYFSKAQLNVLVILLAYWLCCHTTFNNNGQNNTSMTHLMGPEETSHYKM